MNIPSNPAKYGIKLIMLNDAKTKYLLRGIPYRRKDATRVRDGLQLGHRYTKEFTQLYHNTNRNVTIDNWYTSVLLLTDLAKNCGMTLVGSVRGNKKELPDAAKPKVNRSPCSSAFLFTDDMILVTYLSNTVTAKKDVLLMSSIHTPPTVTDTGKPVIIIYYNKTNDPWNQHF